MTLIGQILVSINRIIIKGVFPSFVIQLKMLRFVCFSQIFVGQLKHASLDVTSALLWL